MGNRVNKSLTKKSLGPLGTPLWRARRLIALAESLRGRRAFVLLLREPFGWRVSSGAAFAGNAVNTPFQQAEALIDASVLEGDASNAPSMAGDRDGVAAVADGARGAMVAACGEKVATDEAEAPEGQRRRPRRRRRRSKSAARESQTARQPAAQERSKEQMGDTTESDMARANTGASRLPQHYREKGERIFAVMDRSQPFAADTRDDGAPADIAPHLLDQDGLRILDCLHRNGFEAYFVGGCVRDLLIGQKPKDFDICTSARPEQIRAIFPNCRLIGRRFRLAHLYCRNGNLIEVSTFRAKPPPHGDGEGELGAEDLLIVRDNVFGTSEEDALRRDLTINGLFYDVERGRVLDFVGSGLSDLKARRIRSIGDPEIRLREDPVRILRAVRFAARFGFEIEAATWAAMQGAIGELPRCSAPRLLEETFKFLRSGVAHDSFETLFDIGALDILLPPIAEWLRTAEPAARARFFVELRSMDKAVRQAPVDDTLLLAAILTPLIDESDANHQRLLPAAEQFLSDLAQSARLPRRISDRIRKIFWAEAILTGRLKRKRSLRSFREHPDFPFGLKLLELHVEARGEFQEFFEAWSAGEVPAPLKPPKGPSRGERRRRSRARRTAAEACSSASLTKDEALSEANGDKAARAQASVGQDSAPSQQLSFGFKV